jgi:23S rRNA (adenine2030-N6)-methyltransferase
MNYRHAFHAGNFGDVVKHAVLALLIERLKEKDTAFRVIDTHAGAGMYDLTAGAAERTQEWREGIGRLWHRELPERLQPLLAPYLKAVAAFNESGRLARYPGSPWIARHLLRRQDRLTAVELHPDDGKALAAAFAGDIQVRTVILDGWLALGSFVPPKERRGLVLVDPGYGRPGSMLCGTPSRTSLRSTVSERSWPRAAFAGWSAQNSPFVPARHEPRMAPAPSTAPV